MGLIVFNEKSWWNDYRANQNEHRPIRKKAVFNSLKLLETEEMEQLYENVKGGKRGLFKNFHCRY